MEPLMEISIAARTVDIGIQIIWAYLINSMALTLPNRTFHQAYLWMVHEDNATASWMVHRQSSTG